MKKTLHNLAYCLSLVPAPLRLDFSSGSSFRTEGNTFTNSRDIPPGLSHARHRRPASSQRDLRDSLTFRAGALEERPYHSLKAGEYRSPSRSRRWRHRRHSREMSSSVASRLPGRLDVFEMAKVFESKDLVAAESFVEAGRGASSCSGYVMRCRGTRTPAEKKPKRKKKKKKKKNPPKALPRRKKEARLVHQMNPAFEHAPTPEIERLRQHAISPCSNLRLWASIRREETVNPSDVPVASVYENRLRVECAAVAIPTVIYALELAPYDGNIRPTICPLDSPYNTYRTPTTAGADCLAGPRFAGRGVQPPSRRYLYFGSKNDGFRMYSETLAEHSQQNGQRLSVEYFRAAKSGGQAPRERLVRGGP